MDLRPEAVHPVCHPLGRLAGSGLKVWGELRLQNPLCPLHHITKYQSAQMSECHHAFEPSLILPVINMSLDITLGKEMANHSSVLAWRIRGAGERGGLPSMGSHRVRHNWSDLAAAADITHFSKVYMIVSVKNYRKTQYFLV